MKFFIKRFIKDYDNLSSASVRTAYGKFTSYFGIFCNIILFLCKIIVGITSGSVSITADAVNNLSDASSSIISFFGFKLSDKPADAEHPYGHGRYEYISGLMVAVLILIIGVELFKSSVEKILNPSSVQISLVMFFILLFSIIIKLWMMFFYKKIGKMINSMTLFAASADSRNDAITTSAVLIASVISHFTGIELDSYMGLAVAVFIIVNGFGLIKDTIAIMLGKAPDSEFVEKIRQKILTYDGVLGTHDLMIHDYGPGRQFASVHVEMAAESDVIFNHEIIDNIERDFLENENIHMIIHFDPIVTNDSTTNNVRVWLSEKIKTINSDLSIHDFRIVPGKTHTNLIFDCLVPSSVNYENSELRDIINKLVKEEYPDYYCVITFDKSYIEVSKK